ncbi:haloacid dehalogenase-like hydrolase [bacterium]|nr:haloacid dehalogenase-like hydrolase [bacterium]
MKWKLLLGLALSAQLTAQPLVGGNWDDFNRAQLNQLLQEYGRSGPHYQADRPPYAVFDWDNTSIFLDVEEAAFNYQVAQLRFLATPDQLQQAIRVGVPTGAFASQFDNQAGRSISIETCATDIVESYRWLYEHYAGLNGHQSLEQVKQSPHYGNFTSKIRYLYEALDGTFGAPVSYPWITHMFTGMTRSQVAALTHEAIVAELAAPIAKITWTSPSELPGRAGVVSVTWNSGLRLVPEMQQLYGALRAQGFDVWVCSASFVDVIEEISGNSAFGYNHPTERVLAMELERDHEGRILTQTRVGYEQTHGPGKTQAIRRRLVARYGYGPILVAGDSEGDQNMMQDFPDTRKVLIVNRLRSPQSIIGQLCRQAQASYGRADAKYLLQGRDDNSGLFRPSPASLPLGAEQAKILP